MTAKDDPHAAEALSVIKNRRLPHKRRLAMARWAIKHKVYMDEALTAMAQIVKAPDDTVTTKALDMATRLLATASPLPRPQNDLVYFADTGVGRLMYEKHVAAGGRGKIIAVEQFRQMSLEQINARAMRGPSFWYKT
jgi:hypothetical protein